MVDSSDADRPAQGSHLFTLRLWLEELGSGQTDWRGKVQHVSSGEARYFRDWPTLEGFVVRLLREMRPQEPHADGGEETGTASRGS
jgi:hypothetical protein